jgi:hypothetical protein
MRSKGDGVENPGDDHAVHDLGLTPELLLHHIAAPWWSWAVNLELKNSVWQR